MIVQSGANKYRVGFYYSKPEIIKDTTSGRVLYIENANRVTTCKFQQIEPGEGPQLSASAKTDKNGKDQFSRKIGRQIAFTRVLDTSGLPDEEKKRIKREVFKKMKHGEKPSWS